MISHAQYITYFETIAGSHVSIKQFFTDSDRLFGLKVPPDGFTMLLEREMNRVEDNGSDNILEHFNCMIYILKPCKVGNFVMQEEIINDAKQICVDILSRVRKDVHTFPKNNSQPWVPKSLNLNSVRMAPQLDFTNNMKGMSIEFDFLDTINLAYDNAKWQ